MTPTFAKHQLVLIASITLLTTSCQAFAPALHQPRAVSSSSSSSSSSSLLLKAKISPTNEDAMPAAAAFMLDSFWLSSPQGLVIGGDAVGDTSALVQEQTDDFEDKYGARMGKRVLDTILLEATQDDDGSLIGLVGLEVSLLDKEVRDTISATKSQALLQNAVASLGPKDRRQYKNASAQQIATELLPPHLEPVAVLSNLVVSQNARRQGIAKQLCEAVEDIVRGEEWGYNQLYLRVEKDNEAARTLYEKLGFTTQYELSDSTAVRIENDAFTKVPAEIWVMSKDL